MRPSGENGPDPDPETARLLQQIAHKSDELWLLGISLQELKLRDRGLFDKQDFNTIKGRCKQILRLVEE